MVKKFYVCKKIYFFFIEFFVNIVRLYIYIKYVFFQMKILEKIVVLFFLFFINNYNYGLKFVV